MEKKDLIIRELCKRLIHTPLLSVVEDGIIIIKKVNPANIRQYIKEIKESELDYKLVLRPLCTMTDEHYKNLELITNFDIDDIRNGKISLIGYNSVNDLDEFVNKLYEYHYDINGFIESGLAEDGMEIEVLNNERFMKK